MIYRQQVIKELIIRSIGLFFILLIILFAIQLVNLLGQVARGSISTDLFIATFGVSIIGLMPLLLCITCFISILTVLSRYWQNSEMTVYLTSGLSLIKWIVPVCLFVLPFVLIICFLTLYLIPSINEKSFAYAHLMKNQPGMNAIQHGIFIPTSNGMLLIKEFNVQTGQLQSFFSHTVDPSSGKFEITLARSGLIEMSNNGVQIVLTKVSRYLGYPHQADFSVFTIPKLIYYMQSNPTQTNKLNLVDRKDSLPNKVLWHTDNSVLKSTLAWRLSIPLATIILALLAIPLSYINQRSNKNNIIMAIVIFFLYQNGLILLRNLIAREMVGFWVGLLVLHGLMLLLTCLFFRYRTLPRNNFLYC